MKSYKKVKMSKTKRSFMQFRQLTNMLALVGVATSLQKRWQVWKQIQECITNRSRRGSSQTWRQPLSLKLLSLQMWKNNKNSSSRSIKRNWCDLLSHNLLRMQSKTMVTWSDLRILMTNSNQQISSHRVKMATKWCVLQMMRTMGTT